MDRDKYGCDYKMSITGENAEPCERDHTKLKNCSQCTTLHSFLNNIPGGVQQCRYDDAFTIIEVNNGFLYMFGYTREELQKLFQNQYIKMIHPEDRGYVLQEVKRQTASKDTIEIEYRALCKSGHVKWVLERSTLVHIQEEDVFFCVIIDITASKNLEKQLQMSLERHKIIMNQTKDIIFEWDIEKDTINYSSNWKKKFGYEPVKEHISTILFHTSHIHPEDREKIRDVLEASHENVEYFTAEFRIQKADEQYIWCLARATQQSDTEGKPVKIVGVIIDIDQERHMIEDLRRRAERDALTGLYNRKETISKIKDYLDSDTENGMSALFMIDTDNFKQINDTQGHLFGDAVLAELSSAMREQVEQNDVIGRIGGDEFMIFYRDVGTKENVINKARSLLQSFRGLQLNQSLKETPSVTVTCSIGISLYPDQGHDFQELYLCADHALYEAKNNGKNGYAVFQTGKNPLYTAGRKASLQTWMNTEPEESKTGNLADYAFDILYSNDDLADAIMLILEIVGKRFDVSRAYIFENSEDGKITTNTFEWCNQDVRSEKDFLQNISYETLGSYQHHFNEDGIFYCRDIRGLSVEQKELFEKQGICSVLQCAIREKGVFKGFVGFDECTGQRLWTQEEVDTLTTISKLLTTFLLKKRAQDKDRKFSNRMMEILDTQDAFIYVIDAQTYRLLFLNKKTKKIASDAEADMFCYEMFFGYEKPCTHCPVRYKLENDSQQHEFYSQRYDIWTAAQALSLEWNGRNAYLIICHDITRYKK